MPFPFTFNFPVPGMANPFAPPGISPTTSNGPSKVTRQRNPSPLGSENEEDILNIGPGSSSSSFQRLPSPARTSKKRGWEPSYSESSRSMTQRTSASGYLDTPAKYREMAEGQPEEAFQYVQSGPELDDALQPPAKRRRGLAGSIVSTALSAALIGTAVGLTVYRLFSWRDRGKQSEPLAVAHEQHPPPPYSETEPDSRSQSSSLPNNTPNVNIIPPTPQRRPPSHRVPRSTPRRRRHGPSRSVNHPTHVSSSNALFPVPKPEFDFSFQPPQPSNEVEEAEDQMDWIGDKLSMLIEEGKRALGREVVVSSETAEDEFDDGQGEWVEDDELAGGRGRSSSPRRVKRKGSQRRIGIRHSPASSYSQPATPLLNSTFPTSESMPSVFDSVHESPEIRESMERARRKIMEARAARAGASPFT